MSTEKGYERRQLPSLSDLKESRLVGEKKARSWMQQIEEFSSTKKGMAVLGLTAGLGIMEALNQNPDIRRKLYDAGHKYGESLGLLEHEEPILTIDRGFEEVGFAPDVIHTGVQEAFGSLVLRNVDRVEFERGHRPMPSAFRGLAPYAAGVCFSSEAQGVRSRVVLTIDNFQGISIDQSVHTLFHEIAHALDPENADIADMPTHIATALRTALQDIVKDDQSTLYPYVNEYEGGSRTQAEEDKIQRKELFAELIADSLMLPPLPAESPLLRLPVARRYEVRLAQTHNKTIEEMRPYAQVLAIVTEWRGEDFFERGQYAHERLVLRLQANRDRRTQQEQSRFFEQVRTETNRLVIPGLSANLERWAQTSYHGELEEIANLVDFFSSAETDRTVSCTTELEDQNQARHLLDTTVSAIQAARRAYNLSYLQDVHDANLRAIFLRLTGSLDEDSAATTPLENARHVVRSIFLHPPQARAHMQKLYRVQINIEVVNNLIRQAEQAVPAHDREGMAFRTAILAWVEGETAGTWYRQIDQQLPDLESARHQIRDLTGTLGEGAQR